MVGEKALSRLPLAVIVRSLSPIPGVTGLGSQGNDTNNSAVDRKN
jgi:hypothetical protein